MHSVNTGLVSMQSCHWNAASKAALWSHFCSAFTWMKQPRQTPAFWRTELIFARAISLPARDLYASIYVPFVCASGWVCIFCAAQRLLSFTCWGVRGAKNGNSCSDSISATYITAGIFLSFTTANMKKMTSLLPRLHAGVQSRENASTSIVFLSPGWNEGF